LIHFVAAIYNDVSPTGFGQISFRVICVVRGEKIRPGPVSPARRPRPVVLVTHIVTKSDCILWAS
jgi:hypothetical protein